MEEGEENPYIVAEGLYNELYNLTLKLAEAADSHSYVPFEFDEILATKHEGYQKRDLSDSTADDQLRLYSYFLSQTWEEANRFFNGGFSTSLKQNLQDDEIDWVSYEILMEDYKALSTDIKQLDAAIGTFLDQTPSDDPEEFVSSELIHKGPGLVK